MDKKPADSKKTVAFSDSMRRGARQMGFADDNDSLAALLAGTPSAPAADETPAAPADQAAHEAAETPEKEAMEEKGVKENPKTLMDDIKKVLANKDIAKEVKDKGEAVLTKLEELDKSVEDAKTFLAENKPAAPEEMAAAAPEAK